MNKYTVNILDQFGIPRKAKKVFAYNILDAIKKSELERQRHETLAIWSLDDSSAASIPNTSEWITCLDAGWKRYWIDFESNSCAILPR